MDKDKLAAAMRFIGRNEKVRGQMIALLLDFEASTHYSGGSLREDVTGPIVDALHDKDTVVEKTLCDGTQFHLLYRTKIAREFAMSDKEHPDHVWEPQTTKLLVYLAAHAKHALVGGAYSGDHTILMAKRMRPSGGICHAFEPNVDQLSMLRKNADMNNIDNIKSWSLGLWSDSNTHLALVGDDSLASSIVAHKDSENTFRTMSIDDYVTEQNMPSLGVIMLDIEGGELQALKGARNQLGKPMGEAPNVVFEVHRHYVDWSDGLQNTEIVRFMQGFGYHVYAIRDFNSNVDMTGRPIELIPASQVYLEGPPHGFNMMAIKDEALLDDPIFRICHHVSPKLLWHKDSALHHPMH